MKSYLNLKEWQFCPKVCPNCNLDPKPSKFAFKPLWKGQYSNIYVVLLIWWKNVILKNYEFAFKFVKIIFSPPKLWKIANQPLLFVWGSWTKQGICHFVMFSLWLSFSYKLHFRPLTLWIMQNGPKSQQKVKRGVGLSWPRQLGSMDQIQTVGFH